jgi:hypothetical protein
MAVICSYSMSIPLALRSKGGLYKLCLYKLSPNGS